MMTDTTIYGYLLADGTVTCTSELCSGITRWGSEQGFQALMSHDDNDGDGLSCERCGEYVFEPYFDLVWESEENPLGGYLSGAYDELTRNTPDGFVWQDLDVDYGQAVALAGAPDRNGAGVIVAIFATPDHPSHLNDGEV